LRKLVVDLVLVLVLVDQSTPKDFSFCAAGFYAVRGSRRGARGSRWGVRGSRGGTRSSLTFVRGSRRGARGSRWGVRGSRWGVRGSRGGTRSSLTFVRGSRWGVRGSRVSRCGTRGTLDFARGSKCSFSFVRCSRDGTRHSRSCINIKNTDDLCFKYAVLCIVHKVNEQIHPERVSKYKDLLNTTHVKFGDLPFPMPINKIDKFEQLNNNTISINVFDLQDWTEENATRSKRVRPVRLTKIKSRDARESHVPHRRRALPLRAHPQVRHPHGGAEEQAPT
jgi:hypothetical protein